MTPFPFGKVSLLLESMPKEKFVAEEEPQEVEFKWDTYHEESISDFEDDDDDEDWDEDDYDVEVVYQR